MEWKVYQHHGGFSHSKSLMTQNCQVWSTKINTCVRKDPGMWGVEPSPKDTTSSSGAYVFSRSLKPFNHPVDAESALIERWRATTLSLVKDVCSFLPCALGRIDMNRNFKNALVSVALGRHSLLLAVRISVISLHIPKAKRKWMITKLDYVSGTISHADDAGKVGRICLRFESSPK